MTPNSSRPQLQRLGSAVVLQGQMLAELRWALAMGLQAMSKRDGYVPPSLYALQSELKRAIAARDIESGNHSDEGSGNAAKGNAENVAQLTKREWIGSAEAASLLGLQPRQVRNLRDLLGGRKKGKALVFHRAAVEAEAERRKEPQ